MRQAALGLLPSRRCQELHDKAVKRLESAGTDEPTQLAYHAFAALPFGSIGKAVSYSQAAAAQAASGFAYEDAARLYRQALAAAAQRLRPASLERAELLVAFAEVASRTAEQQTARASAVDAFRLASRLRQTDLCARAAGALGPNLLRLQTGAVDEQQVDLLEEALRLVPRRQQAQRVRLHSQLAVALYWSSDSRRGVAAAETAVELARKLRQPASLAHALYARCVAQWRPSAGRVDPASVRENKARTMACWKRSIGSAPRFPTSRLK